MSCKTWAKGALDTYTPPVPPSKDGKCDDWRVGWSFIGLKGHLNSDRTPSDSDQTLKESKGVREKFRTHFLIFRTQTILNETDSESYKSNGTFSDYDIKKILLELVGLDRTFTDSSFRLTPYDSLRLRRTRLAP